MTVSFAKLVGLVAVALANSCAQYGPCGELEQGDRVRVVITEVSKTGCPTEIGLGVGTMLELHVEGEIPGERCVSKTGSMLDPSHMVQYGKLGSTSVEDRAFGDFYGEYGISPAAADCRIELGFGFEDPGQTGINGSLVGCGEDYYGPCLFNAKGSAERF